MQLKVKHFNIYTIRYRPGSSDEGVIKEVVEDKCYKRKSIGFDVENGEHWLDLGANIGAFALYCKLNGATAECYEPSPDCYSLLKINTMNWKGFSIFNAAVSDHTVKTLYFYPRRDKSRGVYGNANYYRGTLIPPKKSKEEPLNVLNKYCGLIKTPLEGWSGIKMDIEGGEGCLLDKDLLPKCQKLVLEYHTSVDDSMKNLKRRLEYLKSRFKIVSYVAELDKLVKLGGNHKSFMDRLIWCMEPK